MTMTGLERFKAAVRAHAERFAPPPSREEVSPLFGALGLPAPSPHQADLGALLEVCDGSALDEPWSKHAITADDGLALLSVEEIAREKQLWDGFAREYLTFDEEGRRERYHFGFWNPAWIPIASALDEVYALATEPCFGGPAGLVDAFDYIRSDRAPGSERARHHPIPRRARGPRARGRRPGAMRRGRHRRDRRGATTSLAGAMASSSAIQDARQPAGARTA